MKQTYHPYWLWEDYKNGMYNKMATDNKKIQSAAILLSKPEICYRSMKDVIINWIISTEHNLSNLGTNRRAWLGQAACCYSLGVDDETTKKAWNTLKKKEQTQANKIAEKLILWWEKEVFFYKYQKRIEDYY